MVLQYLQQSSWIVQKWDYAVDKPGDGGKRSSYGKFPRVLRQGSTIKLLLPRPERCHSCCFEHFVRKQTEWDRQRINGLETSLVEAGDAPQQQETSPSLRFQQRVWGRVLLLLLPSYSSQCPASSDGIKERHLPHGRAGMGLCVWNGKLKPAPFSFPPVKE